MTAVPDLAAWLREAILERETAAEAASSEHLCPEARSGQWQVVGGRHVTYGNGAGETLLAVDVTGGSCLWYEQVWVKGDPDGTVAAHVAANDPRDTIARCEAELAILDEHCILHSGDRSERYEEFSVVPHPGKGGDQGFGCVSCHYYGQGGVWGKGYCRTVRLLGSGYRHRDGYLEEWAP